MEAILEQVVRSLQFPDYVGALNEALRREQAARQAFRASLDEDVRAEFINGEVVRRLPSRDSHTVALQCLARLLGVFAETRHAGAVRSGRILTAFTRNDYLPDVCFFSGRKSERFEPSTTIYPIPDFVCEILSPSTVERDRGVKFEDYAAHAIGEYWIVDPDAGVIEQYVLRDARYKLNGRLATGDVIRSTVLDGFEMPVAAAFDEQANLAALRRLLATP